MTVRNRCRRPGRLPGQAARCSRQIVWYSRHSGARIFPVIPHIYRHSPYLPSFPISTVIPAQAGIQRRPRTPPFPVAMARPPNHPKNPQFSMTQSPCQAHIDAVHWLQQVRQSGPKGETSPQKPTRPPKYTATRRTANPTRQKASGEKSGNHKNRVQDNTAKPSVLQPSSDPARTPLYSTGVCQATPRAFPPLYAGPAMGRGMEN